MILKLNSIIFLIILFSIFSCRTKKEHFNTIAFSCIKCSGCVSKALKQINKHELYKYYSIVIDKKCNEDFNDKYSFHVDDMDQEVIFKQFGRFGNFVLYDNKGIRIEFKTDMNLLNHINLDKLPETGLLQIN